MQTDPDEVRREILACIDAERKGISISSIARKTGINRHTVARHLDLLELIGKVRKIEMGTAKKYLSISSMPVSGLIDLSADIILILSARLHLQYMNASASRFFHTPLQAVIGKELGTLHFSLLSGSEIRRRLADFSYERSEVIILQDECGSWFEITIIGFSLLQAQNQIAIICTDITEKRRSEEELRLAQEKYTQAFLSSPDGIIMADLETGEIIEVNPSYCSMLGYSWDELMGKTTVELGILVSREERDLLVRRTKNHPSDRCRHNLTIRKKSGETCDAALSTSIIRMQERDCLLTVVRDISELKRNEERIRRSEHHYRLLAESIKDVVWIMDPHARKFRYISPSVIPLLGWRPDELYDKQIDEIIAPEMIPEFIAACKNRYRQFIQDGYRTLYYTDEVRVLTKSGEVIWNEIISHLVPNEETRDIEMIGVSRDITEKKLLHLKLLENEAQFRLISDHMKDVIWILDPVTEAITYVSPSIYRLRGYHPEEIVGHTFAESMMPEHLVIFIAELRRRIRAFESGDDSVWYDRTEVRQKHRNGGVVTIEISTSLVAGPDRKVIHVVGVSREITRE